VTEPSKARVAARKVADAGRDKASQLGLALAGLYDRAVDQVLARPHRVASAAQAHALLASGGVDQRQMSEQIQKVAVLAVPVVRRLARTGRIPGVRRVPWVFTATTAAAVSVQLRQGVREMQVLGSYLATRIEDTTGRPADPELVKRTMVELYLRPEQAPNLTKRRARTGSVARSWLVRGLLGRDGDDRIRRAIAAVERLDVDELASQWAKRHDAIEAHLAETPARDTRAIQPGKTGTTKNEETPWPPPTA
jgi:hypothetical protein